MLGTTSRTVLAVIIFLCSTCGIAGDTGVYGVRIATLDTRGSVVLFSVTGATPPNTCTHWGRHFYVDTTTPTGRVLFQALLAYKLSNSTIDVAYTNTPPASVGAVDANCPGEVMARPWAITMN